MQHRAAIGIVQHIQIENGISALRAFGVFVSVVFHVFIVADYSAVSSEIAPSFFFSSLTS